MRGGNNLPEPIRRLNFKFLDLRSGTAEVGNYRPTDRVEGVDILLLKNFSGRTKCPNNIPSFYFVYVSVSETFDVS